MTVVVGCYIRTPAFATLALAWVAGIAAAQTGEPLRVPDNPLRGRLLFEGKHCDVCHALAGGRKGVGPTLGEGHFRGSFLDLGAAMWNHVPGMSVRFEGSELPWPQLTADEAQELIAFLYFIEYLGRPGDAGVGRRIFASKGCTACHAIGAAGAARGPDLSKLVGFASPLFVAQAIWNHGPSMLGRMRAAGIPPPKFEGGDLADLSAFIRQAATTGPQERVLLAPGNPNRGRTVFETKSCAVCHAVRGNGGNGGPDLAQTDVHRSAEAIACTMWNHALGMSALVREKGLPWPSLTTVELADLVAYLYFLPFADLPGDPARGAAVFANRSCAGCHSRTTTPGSRGPDLASSVATRSSSRLVAAMWNHAPVMKAAILGEGRPWPELGGQDLRDLLAWLAHRPGSREP